MKSSNQRVFGLDLARSAAIWMVLFNHLVFLLPRSPGWGSHFNTLGMAGVDLFFALSGYLIGKILIRSVQRHEFHRPHHVGFFLSRRWLRTLPNYLVWFLIYGWCFDHPVMTAGGNLKALFFLSNFTEFTPLPLNQSWSLMVEEWFYLLFPLLLFINLKIYPSRSFLAVAITAIPFLLIPLVLKCVKIDPTMTRDMLLPEIYAVTPLRLDSIMFGVLAAVGVTWFPASKAWLGRRFFHGVFLVAFLGIYYLAETQKVSALWIFYLFDLLFCLWVVALDQPTAERSDPWTRFIVWTSRLSYSIYLAHALVWGMLDPLLVASFPQLHFFVECALLVAATYLASELSYHLVERPFLALRDRKVSPGTFAGLQLWPLAKSAVLGLGLFFLIPAYYNAVADISVRSPAQAEDRVAARFTTVDLWGKSFLRGLLVDIDSTAVSPPNHLLEVRLKSHRVPVDDYLHLRFQATLPRGPGVPNRRKPVVTGSDIFVEVYARRDGHRRMVLRKRLDPNDPGFGWQQIEVPLRRTDEKIDIAVVQHSPLPAEDAPRTAWLAF